MVSFRKEEASKPNALFIIKGVLQRVATGVEDPLGDFEGKKINKRKRIFHFFLTEEWVISGYVYANF